MRKLLRDFFGRDLANGWAMSLLAKDVMTPDPQCCTAEQPLNEVAQLMVECNCGEIPVVDANKKLVGVVTDRDIVCRVVAQGKNPSAVTAEEAMSSPVISVSIESSLDAVMGQMEQHQIRRVPVVDAEGCCCGIISQADVALKAKEQDTGEMVRAVSL
jgi:CBS domain-containing protein